MEKVVAVHRQKKIKEIKADMSTQISDNTIKIVVANNIQKAEVAIIFSDDIIMHVFAKML